MSPGRSCRGPKDCADHGNKLSKLPARGFQASPTLRGEPVYSPSRAPARGISLPFADDELRCFHAIQRRIERALLHAERARARLLKPTQDFKTVRVAFA